MMIPAAALASTGRFHLSERAEPLGESEPRVSGYRWRHHSPKACLVLVHGLQSHAGWFAEAADGLVDRGFAVLAPDRRGSGSSPGSRGDVESCSEWFEEVGAAISRAQADYPRTPVHLVGHCFGANLALGSALMLRPPIRSLVMLAPGLALHASYSLRERLRIALCGLLRPEAHFQLPLEDEQFTRDPEVLAWIREDRLGLRTATARCLLQIRRMNRLVRRRLPELQVPLLVIEAERDRISDNRRNRALLSRALGNRCRFCSFDGEHFVLAEPCREQVLDALGDWVASLGRPEC